MRCHPRHRSPDCGARTQHKPPKGYSSTAWWRATDRVWLAQALKGAGFPAERSTLPSDQCRLGEAWIEIQQRVTVGGDEEMSRRSTVANRKTFQTEEGKNAVRGPSGARC